MYLSLWNTVSSLIHKVDDEFLDVTESHTDVEFTIWFTHGVKEVTFTLCNRRVEDRNLSVVTVNQFLCQGLTKFKTETVDGWNRSIRGTRSQISWRFTSIVIVDRVSQRQS